MVDFAVGKLQFPDVIPDYYRSKVSLITHSVII